MKTKTFIKKLNILIRMAIETQQTIKLQYVGNVRAKPTNEFKVGEFFKWNGGSCTKIIAILKETKTQIIFKTEDPEHGFFERRLKKDRLVGIGDDFEFLVKEHGFREALNIIKMRRAN